MLNFVVQIVAINAALNLYEIQENIKGNIQL